MKPSSRKGRVSQDRWMVSYADFITLLFAFFVVLYAFSKTDQKKQTQVSEAIDGAFQALGIFPGDTRQTIPQKNVVMGENVVSPARVKDDLNSIRRELEQTLSSQIAARSVSIQMGHEGLVISLREAGFFNSGSATPKPETLPTLRRVAASLSRTPYDLRIEGHTDNVPIHTAEFNSNWELSSARATHIAHLFLDLKAVSPERLSAAGYAEFHPVASNDTADGRAQNRRVDLVILPRSRIDLSTPEVAPSSGAWRKITDGDATNP